MKLCARQIPGGDTSPGSWTDSDLGADPPFKIVGSADAVPTNYNDVSSIDTFAAFGPQCVGKFTGFMDWKCLRDELKTRIEAVAGSSYSTWASLTAAQKAIALVYVPTSVINSQGYGFFAAQGGTPTHIDGYIIKAMNARKLRSLALVKFAYEKLGQGDGIKAENDAIGSKATPEEVTGPDLLRRYTDRGVMVKSADPVEGMEDWLRSSLGTSFSATGLQAKLNTGAYTFKDAAGQPLAVDPAATQTFVDSCVNILNGVY